MKLLLIIKVPPPITGVTLTNIHVKELLSKLNDIFLKSIEITYKKKLSSKNYIYSIFVFFKVFFSLLYNIIVIKPDIVYFQLSLFGFSFLRDFFILFFIKIFKIKIVYHIHGKGIYNVYKNSAFFRFLYKFTFKNEYIICLSNMLKNDLELFESNKIFIVNNGIKKNKIHKLQQKKNKDISVLYLSHIQLSKGIIDYILSIKIFSSKYYFIKNKVKYYIVGEEYDISKKYIINFLKDQRLNDFVEYLGPKYNDEKIELLNSIDVLVYPSLNDAFPLVLLEAMQFGIPVIATREGAIPEIVDDGITGFLVDKNSPEQIAEKLKILLENHDLRYQMGVAARKKFQEKYTLEIFEKNMLNVFTEISKSLE